MPIIQEFREFAVKGNVVDMAVGVVIGGAFGKIVTSLVADVIMPPIGLLLGGADFKEIAIVLKAATATAPAVSMKIGVFLNTILEFLIITFSIFMVIKTMNRFKKEKVEETPPAPPAPSGEEVILTEIRDLLKNRS